MRIVELEAFENLQMVPTTLAWRREKLVNSDDRWSIRIDSNFRLEFIALDINENLAEIKNLKIMEVSKHYG